MKRLIAIALLSCQPTVTPAPASECDTACAVLERLECPEAKPTTKGLTCVLFCEQHENDGLIQIGCVARSQTLGDVRQCAVRCDR